MLFTIQVIIYTPFVFVFLYLALFRILKTPHHVCIVVLGDIGRSPRMLYHALSLADEGYKVWIVGYRGSVPPKRLTDNESIQFCYLKGTPAIIDYLPKMFQYVLKVVWQSAALSWTLLLMPKMGSYLIQNPPSIPTMAVTYVVAKIRSSMLMIDWHNYGYTILALALSPKHPLVRVAKKYEEICGRLSDVNICVTKAMKEDLDKYWGVKATTVYDRPPVMFRSVSLKEKHNLYQRIGKVYPLFSNSDDGCTAITKALPSGEVVYQPDRPAVLVSSTSWTEDEDFGILLEALKDYDTSPDVPDLICVITGKGPQKEYYSKQIDERSWEKVKFCLPWLSAEDYPTLLASADVGVCLHKSSSGLDLPMKVVDMFGCGLPVCAVEFDCIGELVKNDVNGLIFHDSAQLYSQIKDLLTNDAKLERYSNNLKSFQAIRWHDQWKELVLPIFDSQKKAPQGNRMFNPTRSGIPENLDD